MPIEAVLFDFDGVLRTSPFTLIGELGAGGSGLDPQVVLELTLGPYEPKARERDPRFGRDASPARRAPGCTQSWSMPQIRSLRWPSWM